MSLRPIHLISLMAWAVVMWDRTLLVETADQENKNVSSASRYRLPPGIIVPLPYVYPEYIDPREQTTTPVSDISTTKKSLSDISTTRSPLSDSSTTKTSLNDMILEDVTRTMLKSMSVDKIVPIELSDINNPIKRVNDSKDESMPNKQEINNQAIEEIKRRPSGNRPIRFGTRLRTSTANSAKQDFLETAASSDMKNETKTAWNEKPIRQQSSSIRIPSRRMPTNVARNGDEVSARKRPVSKVRKVVTRRRRPTAENSRSVHTSVRRPVKSENTESESATELEKPNVESTPMAF